MKKNECKEQRGVAERTGWTRLRLVLLLRSRELRRTDWDFCVSPVDI
ncbi:hypothetical protein [Treponema sp.]|nr:hypothetical protein [Treponema sp.]